MKGFAKREGSEEDGFTLIEIIAALTIFSMIVGLISGVTMYGFRSYHKITVENALRNESDLIMSSIITELYTYGAERVQNTADKTGIELMKSGSPSRVIQVVNNDFIISGNSTGEESGSPLALKSEVGESTITAVTTDGRECTVGATTCDSGLIQIKLVLKYEGNDEDRLEMNSQFGF